jgi:hypothetical protein
MNGCTSAGLLFNPILFLSYFFVFYDFYIFIIRFELNKQGKKIKKIIKLPDRGCKSNTGGALSKRSSEMPKQGTL